MTKKSCWLGDGSLPKFPKLSEDLKVDVAVIGAGMTGVTAAYLLKKAGRNVALVERDRWGHVDTGHTTAHLTFVTDVRLSRLVKDFGNDHARAAWDAGRAAIDQIETLVNEEAIDCGFGRTVGFLHAAWDGDAKKEAKELRGEARLAEELSFDALFRESVPLADRPGIRFPNQAKFHPLEYLSGLIQRIPGGGSHVFEESEATEFHEKPRRVVANGRTIICGHVVIATHVPLMGTTGSTSAALFQSKLASYTSYAVGARLPSGSAPEALFWDTSDPYYYLRIDRNPQHDYAIFGGEDHKTGQHADPEACFDKLEKRLLALLPDARVIHRWSGQVVETNDGLPYIGATAERQFAATGYSGNGMTFGTLGGMMAADWVLGRKNPWAELFDAGRTKVKGGAWDYIKENLDYPYYYLKDRLTRAEGESLADVAEGEGKILDLNGERVAVHRSAQGKLTTLSPYCTHMGCIVRWNAADATWDCPCHGSRFRPNGDVLAGPAETPLDPVETPAK